LVESIRERPRERKMMVRGLNDSRRFNEMIQMDTSRDKFLQVMGPFFKYTIKRFSEF
jgi:hypothetical protein